MSGLKCVWAGLALGSLLILGTASAGAQEKRTIFSEGDFHWQGSLKAGQTLEVINRNGEIDASGASGDTARASGMRRGDDENHEFFIEVVEYSDGVVICAVYAKDKTPRHCHHGGVSNDNTNWSWHGHRARMNFDVQVPRGVNFKALTTNGDVRCRDLNSVVEARTTNGRVEISTSEWASAKTTNGSVNVSMGKAGWSGELELMSTNGGVEVTLPASAQFNVRASTTNGSVRTDFPVTVQGSFMSKHLEGSVGGGGRELHVATTNGGIELRKS